MQKQEGNRWLGAWSQHALPTALAVLTVAGVAGYAVGRAYLEGWYTAAGISPLAFSWEVQYVVLRGLSSDVLLLWIGVLGTISALILLYGCVDVVSDSLRDRWTRRQQRKGRIRTPEQPSKERPFARRFGLFFFLAYVPIALALIWFVSAKLLTEMPKQQGTRDFIELHAGATCRLPAWIVPDATARAPMDVLRSAGVTELQRYRWVEVQSPALVGTAQGWLMQMQGSTLLLLSPTGVDLLSFGGSQFRVSNIPAPPASRPHCNTVSPITASPRPTFKADGAPTAAP